MTIISGDVDFDADEQDLIGFIKNNSLSSLKSRLIQLLISQDKHNNSAVKITEQL